MSTTAAETAGAPDAPPPEATESASIVGRSPSQLFWMRFRQDRFALAGLAVILLLVLLAIFAPAFAALVGHGPNELFQRETTDVFGIPEGPTSSFWFGADNSGRDVFVRTIYGTRVSLLVGVVATLIAVVVGIVLGVIAGYYGGALDTFISRTTDIILSVPLLLFAIGIVAACSTSKEGCFFGTIKPGMGLVILIISLFTWPYVARLVRGNTLSLREREFVEASRSLGAGDLRIMFREILPNLISPIIVYASLLIPSNILFEAYLSFLGLGVPDETPSWGNMVSDSLENFDVVWWLWLFPGLFLLVSVLAFNLLGDGLRDALDPRADRS
ncbi:ABC transporter permease [Miltoncostaea oceani]|uniref:ABC transporter permease n=1 Tax=Miltoncostaea oceani TaxID=2843216 RepID=UPI001C3E047E|nr:ABC transporter permease [Miltoncostaea oceani]